MKTLLLTLTGWLPAAFLSAQDSSYYNPFWKPEALYRKAGATQEGVFVYAYKKGKLVDSTLVQTFLYDSLGRVTRRHDYRGGKVRTQFTFFYNGGQLDSTVQEERWLGITVTNRFAYDSAGNLTLHAVYRGGKKTIQHRYVYNRQTQPVQQFTQIGNGPEYLSSRSAYRSDGLVRRVDFFSKRDRPEADFSKPYSYGEGRTVTVFYQHPSNGKRYIDFIKTFDGQGQTLQTIFPPLEDVNWLPSEERYRREEEVETCVYHSNGLLYEKQRRRDGELVFAERHYYF